MLDEHGRFSTLRVDTHLLQTSCKVVFMVCVSDFAFEDFRYPP